ncbi:O-antigen polysaccharide polymerase Wzy [Bacteroides sp. BFG-551]|nr:O-antigen polysaccharide polymerase Wzy [Bacteroides sp. BFG-551]
MVWLEHIQEKADYFYGQACFVYPFVMWIPRTVWQNKPVGTDFPAGVALLKSCPSALKEAMSFPNIYEYYIDFGPIGVVVITFFIGVFCKKMIRLYNSNSIYDVICYALFVGFLIQFINRGYIAQLITLLVFLYMPLFFYKNILNLTNKNETNNCLSSGCKTPISNSTDFMQGKYAFKTLYRFM